MVPGSTGQDQHLTVLCLCSPRHHLMMLWCCTWSLLSGRELDGRVHWRSLSHLSVVTYRFIGLVNKKNPFKCDSGVQGHGGSYISAHRHGWTVICKWGKAPRVRASPWTAASPCNVHSRDKDTKPTTENLIPASSQPEASSVTPESLGQWSTLVLIQKGPFHFTKGSYVQMQL